MPTMSRVLPALLVLASGCYSPPQELPRPVPNPRPRPQEAWRWVYAPCNFQVNESVGRLIALMERAKKAGYNGVLVPDYKFGRIAGRMRRYYTNLERTKAAADRIGIEIIPGVMPIGYSNSILQNNPNLAEGIAVKDCAFVVKEGRAAVADRANLLPFGGFEEGWRPRKRPPGWTFVDGPGKSTFRDTKIKHSGAASLRMANVRAGNEAGNCRVMRRLAVRPRHQYHLSFWMKTRGVSSPGSIRAVVLGGGRSLNFTNVGARGTQDWRRHDIIFNTLDATQAGVYVGIWNGRGGTIWLDDISLRQTAGINLLRREGCPVRVTSADGATEYVEGRDFERWHYPKMGREPWPGEFRVVHPEPPIMIPQRSRIKNGDRLHVSFYHAVVIYDGQVCCCLRSEELFEHLEQQIRQLKKYLAPRKYFMNHDEIRVAGQCALCRAGGRTAGQVLAENVRRCAAIIRKVEPGAEVFVWSDMFDPNHNARDNYYLVGSTLKGSWEGLDPSVRIANWSGKRASLAFFAGRGHQQIIAGYYDTADVKGNVTRWNRAASGLDGVNGFIYTTWRNNYRDLETFAKEAWP